MPGMDPDELFDFLAEEGIRLDRTMPRRPSSALSAPISASSTSEPTVIES